MSFLHNLKNHYRKFRGGSYKIPKRNLIYIPIPKIACTSFKRYLYKEYFYHNFPARDSNKKPLISVHAFFPSYPKKRNYLENTEYLVLTRNPAKRFISLYNNRILHHKDLIKEKIFDKTISFEEFIDRFEEICDLSPSIKHHAQPQIDFLNFSENQSVIYLDIDSNNFSKNLEKLNLIGIFKHQTGGGQNKIDLLDHQKKRIENLFQEDFHIWENSTK